MILLSSTGGIIGGFLAAFMQAFGVSAGALRQGFYLKRDYDLMQIQGTVAVIFLFSSTFTILTRVINENSDLNFIYTLLPLFPLILLATYLGKKVLMKIPKKVQEYIIIYSLVISLVFILPYLFQEFAKYF